MAPLFKIHWICMLILVTISKQQLSLLSLKKKKVLGQANKMLNLTDGKNILIQSNYHGINRKATEGLMTREGFLLLLLF